MVLHPPFGMMMPGRTYSAGSDSYRFTINGQEKTPEIALNTTTAEFWQYDSRIARRWNVDPKANPSISVYNVFGANPILYRDLLGDTLRGVNSGSATTQLSVIQDIFTDNEKVQAQFKLNPDGLTFKNINSDEFVEAIGGLTNELKDIAWGYFLVINSERLVEVSYISSSSESTSGLDAIKHAPYINFLRRENVVTNEELIRRFGGQLTLPTNRNNALAILIQDYLPEVITEDRQGNQISVAAPLTANNIHEVLGHGLAIILQLTSQDAVEAIQFENVYYKAMSSNLRNGSDHHNGVTLDRTVRSETPATLIGNRIKMISTPTCTKCKTSSNEYLSY